jgi:hypothetical protein
MFSVKLGSAVRKGNSAVTEAVSGAATGVSEAASGLHKGEWAKDGVGKVRNAAHAAAAVASTTTQEMGKVFKKGNEALKFDQVASSIHNSIQDFNTHGRALAEKVTLGAGRVSNVMGSSSGRERKWDEYHSDEDEDVDVGGGEGDLTLLEKEVLIAGLTDSEDIGPAVRAVHERGVAEKLAQALEDLASQRFEDIRKECDQERALDMMRSVQLMASLKEEAGQAESRIADINRRLQTDGARLLQAQNDIANLRQTTQNLEVQTHTRPDACMQTFTHETCLVCSSCARIVIHVSSYPLARTLEQCNCSDIPRRRAVCPSPQLQ